MSNIPADLKYTKSHEWVRDEGDGTYVVGITDHAQELLGDMVYIEVPEAGSEVTAEDACAVVESVKAASDVYAPLSGEIIEGNEALVDSPELVNTSPYDEGWLFKMSPEGGLEDLLDADAYKELIESEDH